MHYNSFCRLFTCGIPMVALFSFNMKAQSQDYCQGIRKALQQAYTANDFAMVDFHYHKLLNTCQVMEQDKSMVEEVATNTGYSMDWTTYGSYTITDYIDDEVDYTTYNQYRLFGDLHEEHPIKSTYGTVENVLKTFKYDLDNLPQEPLFLADDQILFLIDYGQTVLYDLITKKKIKSFDDNIYAVQYVGNKLIQAFTQTHTQIYKYQRTASGIQWKLLIESEGHANIIPVQTNKSLILIQNTNGDGSVNIYNNEGKLVLKDIQYTAVNLLSRTILLHKKDSQQLVDYNLKSIIPTARYIEEVWINNEPAYIAEIASNTFHLYNLSGKRMYTLNYENVYPYKGAVAIVEHQGKTGLLDLMTNKWRIPLQAEQLYELCPGYYASGTQQHWKIIDDTNHTLSSNQYKTMKYLTDKGALRILVQNEYDHYGVIDAWGKVIVPTSYKQVNYKADTHQLELIHHDHTTSLVNMNGTK